MNFDSLVQTIAGLHDQFRAEALKAVNVGLTVRNWMVGFFVKEYEQNGEDRAEYGTRLFERLAVQLADRLDRCYTERYLRLCRQLYETYPGIWKSLISGKSAPAIRGSASPESGLSASLLLQRLSFTHFRHLLDLDSPFGEAQYRELRGGDAS